MEEVQKNMQKGSLEHFVTSTKDQWMTPDLLTQIQKNPELLKGLQDPEIMQAIALMQVKPAEAKKKYQNNEKVTKFFVEFSKIMGGHFEELGKKEDAQANTKKEQKEITKQTMASSGAEMKKVSEVKKVPSNSSSQSKPNPLLQTTDPVLAKKLEDPGVKVDSHNQATATRTENPGIPN